MYDVIIIGAGIAGATFASKISKYAKTLLIEAQNYRKEIPSRTNIFPEHNRPFIKDEIDLIQLLKEGNYLPVRFRLEERAA